MILVTGANGLIGSFLLKQFISLGYKVRGLVRKTSDLSLLNGVSKEFLYEADILNNFELESAFEDVDCVIHTAAVVSFDPSKATLMRKVNVDGTKNLVNLSIKNNIHQFIHISSVSALGKKSTLSKINESIIWNHEESSNYGATKFDAELEVWRAQTEGLPVLILNPSTTLGPGDWHKSSTQLFKYVWDENKYYSNGILNFVDLRDLSEIVLNLFQQKIIGEKFIVSGGNISYKEFFNLVAKNFSLRPPKTEVTPFNAAISVILAKIVSVFTGKSPFITREVVENSSSSTIYDNSKLSAFLNFSFRPIENTIEWACVDLMKKNLIKSEVTSKSKL